ncbi:MAG: DegT/DnrJ/EryC1/StrS family aminotransferase [Leptolyngbya sp. SIOISBB]|nr:DegT/DnrJ/EryC1/StrS family aminotransferase [Leptolyngbya sp. SIOISBB]
MKRCIPISQPSITDLEVAYVTDAVKSGWVSSQGDYIKKFERNFAEYCGTRYALSTASGTTALHLALVSYGIGSGDEVIVPDLTFVATANVVTYVNAKPVFVDVDPKTLCIDPDHVERAITAKTKAIIAVHLYGHPAAMNVLRTLAQQYNLYLIEDAAEAHGAIHNGQRAGNLGDCAAFSFYGNKLITSGEGGMLTTNDEGFYRRAKYLRDHAMSPQRRYWHTEVGYNYRITNLQAALGVAQLERIDDFLVKKQNIFERYRSHLEDISNLRLNFVEQGSKSSYWMVCLQVDDYSEKQRDQLMTFLKKRGIDSRPYFYPLSALPMYADSAVHTPIAHTAAAQGINLPSYFDMSDADIDYICQTLVRYFVPTKLTIALPTSPLAEEVLVAG